MEILSLLSHLLRGGETSVCMTAGFLLFFFRKARTISQMGRSDESIRGFVFLLMSPLLDEQHMKMPSSCYKS